MGKRTQKLKVKGQNHNLKVITAGQVSNPSFNISLVNQIFLFSLESPWVFLVPDTIRCGKRWFYIFTFFEPEHE